jgi:hypothetical protein
MAPSVASNSARHASSSISHGTVVVDDALCSDTTDPVAHACEAKAAALNTSTMSITRLSR